jgi:hypothetical protein
MIVSVVVAVYYLKFSKTAVFVTVFSGISGQIESMKLGKMSNLQSIDRVMKEQLGRLSAGLMDAWQWFMNDVNVIYEGEAAPALDRYFTLESLNEKLDIKMTYLRSTYLMAFLAFFAAFVCPVVPMLTNDELFGVGMAVGLVSMLFSLLLFLLVTLSYRQKESVMASSLHALVAVVSSRLYSAEAPNNTSLILRSNKEAMETYKTSVEILTERMNRFISEEVTPTITQVFNKTITDHIAPSLAKMDRALAESIHNMTVAQDKHLYDLGQTVFQDVVKGSGESMKFFVQQLMNISQVLDKSVQSYQSSHEINARAVYEAMGLNKIAYEAMNEAAKSNADVLAYLKRSDQTLEAVSASVVTLTNISENMGKDLAELGRTSIGTSQNLSSKIAEMSEGMTALGGKLEDSATYSSSLMTEASDKMSRSFESYAENIDGAFSKYVENLNGTLGKISESNAEVSAKLTNAAVEASGGVEKLFQKYVTGFAKEIKILLEKAEESNSLISSVARKLQDAETEQFEAASEAAAKILEEISSGAGKLAEQTCGKVNSVLEQYSSVMRDSVRDVMESNGDTAKMLAESVVKIDSAGSSQFEKASQVAANMIEGISREMREAMKGIGTDIASTIESAYKESGDFLKQLDEKQKQLIEEYDQYFGNMDQSTIRIMTDLDASITGMVSRLAEDITSIVGSFNEASVKTSEQYEEATKEIMTMFSEQTRDMGLYAHEINADVSVLAAGLKDSIELFNNQMHKGIVDTFVDFDKGVAEFTKRMTDTIEAVREAVEALPAALKR